MGWRCWTTKQLLQNKRRSRYKHKKKPIRHKIKAKENIANFGFQNKYVLVRQKFRISNGIRWLLTNIKIKLLYGNLTFIQYKDITGFNMNGCLLMAQFPERNYAPFTHNVMEIGMKCNFSLTATYSYLLPQPNLKSKSTVVYRLAMTNIGHCLWTRIISSWPKFKISVFKPNKNYSRKFNGWTTSYSQMVE